MMGSLISRFQDCEKVLVRGMILSLKVGFNLKTQKPAFLPQLVEQDNLLVKDSEYSDSFRVFIPDKEVKWQEGEIWIIEIESWHISKKATYDKYERIDRRHIHVYVKILRREENIKEEIDGMEKELVIQKVSGDCLISETRLPILEEEKWFRVDSDSACLVRFYKNGDRIVKQFSVKTISRSEYVNRLARDVKGLSLKSLAKVYNQLPPLSEPVGLF
jgi:hypothetical protein